MLKTWLVGMTDQILYLNVGGHVWLAASSHVARSLALPWLSSGGRVRVLQERPRPFPSLQGGLPGSPSHTPSREAGAALPAEGKPVTLVPISELVVVCGLPRWRLHASLAVICV